jgi:hypothetical protein
VRTVLKWAKYKHWASQTDLSLSLSLSVRAAGGNKEKEISGSCCHYA